ncbi:hypothetical protein E1B28_003932 [Marasmius oreades]|uniref:Uncharacterized protein n=1 Tax=Marasmius oreades TaxID=181124 RepID=A0A9P7UXK3_9AGAR|nr:uncharacterized protein E1B28_003932 [Marasmius oreades]KAG7096502.1 hypothetical protein E1B28_003932 [Marasmius oreades]
MKSRSAVYFPISRLVTFIGPRGPKQGNNTVYWSTDPGPKHVVQIRDDVDDLRLGGNFASVQWDYEDSIRMHSFKPTGMFDSSPEHLLRS